MMVYRPFGVDCVGCAVVSGRLAAPGGVIAETPHFLLHQDPIIPIQFFLVITAKKHERSIKDFRDSQTAELFRLAKSARRAIDEVSRISHCSLIQEERSEHFHLWFFPYHPWMDEQFDQSLSSIRPIMEYAERHLSSDKQLDEVTQAADAVRQALHLTR